MTRGFAGRLIGLLVVFLVGLSYITFSSLGIRLGKQSYPLTVEIPRSGGIYQNATVTYRGVVVGKVSNVDLEPTDVRLVLAIRPNIRIPDSSTVSIRNLSAAGEQYVDFVPHSDGAPYLQSGSTIPASRTHLPATIGNVLADTSMLVRTINPDDVSRIARELSRGFAGAGPQLHRLVTSSLSLLRQLRTVEPDTLTLIRTGHQLLDTATATSGQLRQFADGLQRLSTQLRASDPDIRSILARAPSVLSELATVFGDNRGQIKLLFGDLAPITAIGAARVPAFNFLLHVLPTFGQTLHSIVAGHTLKTFVFINNDTPVCSYRGGSFTLPTHPTKRLDYHARCKRRDARMLQRGAPYAPRPGH
jgi:phospholipid/cholesterol/gamma-HCH transport system substrate-binding protein